MDGSGRGSDVAVATSVAPLFVVAEVCRVLPDPGFVCDIEVVVVVVGVVKVISGTGCAVLAWWYDLRGNSKGAASRDRNSCKWGHVIYWHLSCSDNYSSTLHLSAVLFGIFCRQQVTPE